MLLSLLLHGDAAPGAGWFGYDAARLHAVLNDFPAALLVVAVLFEVGYLLTRRESLRGASFWTLVVGAVSTLVAILSGLKAEDSIQHGQAIHEIMEAHERLGWITLAIFGVLALWRLVRDSKMPRSERWIVVLVGVVGLSFLVATGREGGELVFDHAAGMSTEAMEAEIKNRAGGHEHAEGEEHEHSDSLGAPAADSTAADTTAAAPTHTHAPGTPPHKD